MNSALVRLSLRRTLPAPLLVAFVLLLVLAATRRWVPETTTLLDPSEGALRADDFRRQALWLVFALVALPVLVVRAAGVGTLWREEDADWLGWRPITRVRVLGNAWLGVLAAAVVVVGLTVLASEATTQPTSSATRFERTLAHEALILLPGEEQKGLALEALPDGTQLRVEVTVAPGSGPVASVRASLGGAQQTATVFGRHTFELVVNGGELSTGASTCELAFERVGDGAILVLPHDSIDVVAPAASSRLASVELAARALLAVAAWCALALGLGAWMRTALAAGLTACLALVATRWAAELDWLPGADLVRALGLVGSGLIPPGASWLQAACALLWIVAGLTLARRGLERGRSLPRW